MPAVDLARELAGAKGGKILLVVVDGVGGLPDGESGRTSLETARTPNLDRVAPRASMGLAHAVARGITPGSGPAHMSLFGYDPTECRIGRGILEALGVGLSVGPKDLAVRANFATLDKSGNVADRRAGRPPTEENRRLVGKLAAAIREIDGVEVVIRSGVEHRFAIVFRGEGLSQCVTETDPQATGVPPRRAEPLEEGAAGTAGLLRTFIERVNEALKDEPRANSCLLRGPSMRPDLLPFGERFKLKGAAIASYPMYRGLAELVGMEVIELHGAGSTLEDQVETLKGVWADYDFVFFHVKKTDSAGEDGNFEKKVREIEHFDAVLPGMLALSPDVLVVTCDHSTPVRMKLHSWHPSPFMLVAENAFPDGHDRFTERSCSRGYLGHFPSLEAMPLMLAHAGRLAKFGA